jgi:hypothetical protein
VLSEPGLAERLITSGRRRAEAFTWDNAARSVWRAHLELFG